MKPLDSYPPSSQFPGEPVAPRDTGTTAFTNILEALLQRVSGAYAAALVDPQGETVDYSGRGDPFDLRIAAAELQLVLQGIARFGVLGEPRWVVVRGGRKSIAASVLPEGYALGLLLRSRSAFNISTRALTVCARALSEEAGWGPSHRDEVTRSWFPVTVESDRRGRPVRIAGVHTEPASESEGVAVEVLGALMGLSVRERGFRVRTADGRELTVVREPSRRWYADEAV
jgi:hypothetical protein